MRTNTIIPHGAERKNSKEEGGQPPYKNERERSRNVHAQNMLSVGETKKRRARQTGVLFIASISVHCLWLFPVAACKVKYGILVKQLTANIVQKHMKKILPQVYPTGAQSPQILFDAYQGRYSYLEALENVRCSRWVMSRRSICRQKLQFEYPYSMLMETQHCAYDCEIPGATASSKRAEV